MTKRNLSGKPKVYLRGMGKNKITVKPNRKEKIKKWFFEPRLKNEAVVLHSILPIYEIAFFSQIVNDIRYLISSLVQNHGVNDGSERYNIIKNYTVQLIERRDPVNPGWLSTSRVHKIPSKLGISFSKLLVDYFGCVDEAKLPKYYQAVITILNMSRMIEGGTIADFKSVTDPAKPIDEDLLNNFSAYAEKELAAFKYNQSYTNLSKYRFNLLKRGPNSVPKIESALKEAVTLLEGKLHVPFRRLCTGLGCSHLHSYLEALVAPITSKERSDFLNDTKLRKIVSIPEKGFKTRLVAIVDFWSQLVLEPFRAHVQDVIKKKYPNTDFRLDQNRGVEAMVSFQRRCMSSDVINNHTLDVKSLMFYDISSWTDRFHRDLQKVVVGHLFTPCISESWGQFTVHCDWYSPDLKRTIKYGQGQGMGTNGSFDVATLTDHLFINFLINSESSIKGIFPRNECYGKVGDDLWVYDPDGLIPKFYEKINLPINMTKSKLYDVRIGSIAEFCSRTFWNNVDVSRISPNIINRSKDFRYLPMLLALCASRGIQLYASSFMDNLSIRSGDSQRTRLELLQDWILGMLIIGKYEKNAYFDKLTYEYLSSGGWLTEGSNVIAIFKEPTFVEKIMISHSIVSMSQSLTKLKTLVSDTFDHSHLSQKERKSFFHKDLDFFDIESDGVKSAQKFFAIDGILSPKQIIVLGRYLDQYRSITDGVDDAHNVRGDTSNDMLVFASTMELISTRSTYDSGNINYNPKEVYNTTFSIIKTLERLNIQSNTLRLDDSGQVQTINELFSLSSGYVIHDWHNRIPRLISGNQSESTSIPAYFLNMEEYY